MGNVRIEAVFAAAIIATTAALVHTAPPSTAAGARAKANVDRPTHEHEHGPITQQRAMHGATVVLRITPIAGRAAHSIELRFAERPRSRSTRSRFRVATSAIPARKVALTADSAGRFHAPEVTLTPAGQWTITVTAVRSGDAETAQFEVHIE